MTVGGVRNGAAKEDGHWDLNLGVAAIKRREPRGSEGKGRGPCGSEVKKERTTRF